MVGFKKNEDKKPSKEEELIKRVDAMLDPKATNQPAPATKSTVEPKAQAAPPPLDIFKDTKTAPEVPGATVKPTTQTELKSAPTIEQIADKAEQKQTTEPTVETKPKVIAPVEEQQVEPTPIDESNPKIENKETDKAVEDIVAKEGDALLAAQDAAVKKANTPARKETTGFKAKLKRILKSKTTWAIIAALLIVLFAIPQTRYAILGLVIKKQVSIEVLDSKTNTPVSNALIVIDGDKIKTNPEGKVSISLGVGPKTLSVTKQYYQTSSSSIFIGLKGEANQNVKLAATGRQVPITITNSITGSPVANAEIQVLKTSAKTDKKGKATIVLPTVSDAAQATIKAKGYNDTKVAVQITNEAVRQNDFRITPTGKVYFLSNQSGHIDVVKSNLDGTDRKVVLAGTGKEEARNTSLLASRDWRYVMLKSKRDSGQPALYLIDTTGDKVDQVDSTNGDVEPIGWYGHYFMYSLVNNAVSQSKSGKQVVKSYDADKNQLSQIDQTQAEGNASTYGYQVFDNFHILNNLLSYTVQWNTYDATGNGFSLNGKNDAIRGVQPNGQNKKDYQTFAAAGVSYIQSAQFGPQNVYYSVYNGDNGSTAYYQFDSQSASAVKNIDQGDMNKTYPTYLISPNGSQTLSSDVRDGKYTLFIGDSNGKNPKQISSNGDYAPYGWYGDNMILVSKGNNQLYVMPVDGLPATKQPLKVTNYYRPAVTLTGYGFGYGGL